jgi:hypothetical protein
MKFLFLSLEIEEYLARFRNFELRTPDPYLARLYAVVRESGAQNRELFDQAYDSFMKEEKVQEDSFFDWRRNRTSYGNFFPIDLGVSRAIQSRRSSTRLDFATAFWNEAPDSPAAFSTAGLGSVEVFSWNSSWHFRDRVSLSSSELKILSMQFLRRGVPMMHQDEKAAWGWGFEIANRYEPYFSERVSLEIQLQRRLELARLDFERSSMGIEFGPAFDFDLSGRDKELFHGKARFALWWRASAKFINRRVQISLLPSMLLVPLKNRMDLRFRNPVEISLESHPSLRSLLLVGSLEHEYQKQSLRQKDSFEFGLKLRKFF